MPPNPRNTPPEPPADPTPPAPPAPPAPPPAPPSDEVPGWARGFMDGIRSELAGVRAALPPAPTPRDALAELDALAPKVKEAAEWVASQTASRAPNLFERLVLGHRKPTPPAPPSNPQQ